MISDEIFMLRALELARLGAGNVSPNPKVGCVIVHDNRIIGEGWHQQYGGPHAEVNAIEDVKDKTLLNQSVIYVNLEPCAHTGKTPPCANLLVSHRVKGVVIANEDSNPLVAGKGIQKLKEAGIEVKVGVLEQEGLQLNIRFFTFINKKRPYIILKWAQTADGFLARENYDSKWISNEFSRQLVHKWRAEEDAVLVGARTVAKDDPQLSVRDWSGRNPIRIVIDPKLSLDKTLKVFDGSQKTICYNLKKDEIQDSLQFVKLKTDGGINEIMADLFQKKIQSVIVEGGTQTINGFLNLNLWDEMRVFKSPQTFEGKGILAPSVKGKLITETEIAGDKLQVFRNESGF